MKKNFIYLVTLFVGGLVLASCDSEVESHQSNVEISEQYLSELKVSIKDVLSEDIVYSPQTRVAGDDIQLEGGQKVYINYVMPEDTTEVDISKIKTADDLIRIKNEYGASLSLIKNNEICDSIFVSEEKIKNAFTPLVSSSRAYLNNLGVNDDEINLMLSESNVDEIALVPITIAISIGLERGMQTNDEYLDLLKFGPDDGRQIVYVDIDKALYCVELIFDFEVIESLLTGQLTEAMTIPAFKVLLKNLFKRFLNEVGLAIAVIEWAACYYR